ncbi:MAG: type II secretion system protein GspL [Hydrogenophaga sp.]|uniref:type II secretion system protein GspL n=1 Tax=Hydrogenophaga sp. TaxID=1904254 RepID=UPI00274B775A|nr:type II secretion system protein GspL [Hydrogenophaga sp.]MDP2419180.1 type II secretion system protein GspL [Hydrogenophaga sp.]MDZ4188480.1 type II secretion system protein GspL [Hydrogenophaga sp.]
MLILTPPDFSVVPASGPTALLDWATSSDGQQVLDHGHCAASLLPRDDDVVLVLPPRSVSWHSLALPKVASAKLRAVLDGLLEDRVLSDTTELHFALEPGGRSGQTVWVAACHKAWLQSWLQALEAAGRPVSRIAPAVWPLPATAHTTPDNPTLPSLHWAHDEGGQAWLASANPLGVSCTPLRESGPNSLGETAMGALPPPSANTPNEATRWLADPAVASLAERALDQRFELVSRPQWLLQCAQTDWNLAQFDLSLSSGARRGQRFKQQLRRLRSAPAWRPARWGLAALVAVQLVGLNGAAWSERSSIDAKQQAMRQALQQGFPQVSLVLDAPLQMRRELTRLQQASGTLSTGDLETMLGALSQAAPGDLPVPTTLGYTLGEGRFSGWRASEDQVRALQQRLEQNGWRARFDGKELTLQPTER